MKKNIYLTYLLSLGSIFTSCAPYGSPIHPELRAAFLQHCHKVLDRPDLIKAIDPSYSILEDKELMTLCDNMVNKKIQNICGYKNGIFYKNRESPIVFREQKNTFIMSHILLKVMYILLCDESKDIIQWYKNTDIVYYGDPKCKDYIAYNKAYYTNPICKYYIAYSEANKGREKLFFDEYKKNIKLFYTLMTPKEYQFILKHIWKYLDFSHDNFFIQYKHYVYLKRNNYFDLLLPEIFQEKRIDLDIIKARFHSSTEKIIDFLIENGIKKNFSTIEEKFYSNGEKIIDCPLENRIKEKINTNDIYLWQYFLTILMRIISYMPYIEPSYLLIKNFQEPEKVLMENKSLYGLNNISKLPNIMTPMHCLEIIFIHDVHREFSDYASFFTKEEKTYWNKSEEHIINNFNYDRMSKTIEYILNSIRKARPKIFRRDIFRHKNKMLNLLALQYLGIKEIGKQKSLNYECPQRKKLTVTQLIEVSEEQKLSREQGQRLSQERKTWQKANNPGIHYLFPHIISKQGLIIEIGEFLYGKNVGFSLYNKEDPGSYYLPLLFLDNRDGLLKEILEKFYKKDIYVRHKLLNIIDTRVYEDFYQQIDYSSI